MPSTTAYMPFSPTSISFVPPLRISSAWAGGSAPPSEQTTRSKSGYFLASSIASLRVVWASRTR